MIGIIAAMDIEVQAIEKVAVITERKCVAGCEMHKGTIGDRPIVIGKSGVGKSHAAMAATILCMEQDLDAIINVGTAGGLLEAEQVLDIVISDTVVQADFDTSPIDGDKGIGLVYPVSQDMVSLCVDAAKQTEIPYHVGTIASQDIFMSRTEDYQRLMERFPASACSEMEAGAIAQVCDSFGVSFVIVRSLSDVVHHTDNPMEFSEYAAKASARTARFVVQLIQSL